MLARIVGRGNHPCRLQPLVVLLVRHFEQFEYPVLPQLIAEPGEVETHHEIFDVERGKPQRHGSISLFCHHSVS